MPVAKEFNSGNYGSTGEWSGAYQVRLGRRLLEVAGQDLQCSHCHREVRSTAVHHVALECGVVLRKLRVSGDAVDCFQRLGQWVCCIGWKVSSTRFGIVMHDFTRKGGNVSGIVFLLD